MWNDIVATFEQMSPQYQTAAYILEKALWAERSMPFDTRWWSTLLDLAAKLEAGEDIHAS